MASWVGLAGNRLFRLAAIVLALAGFAAGYFVHLLAGATLLFTAAVVAPFESVLVRVDEDGLTVQPARVGFVRVRFPLAEIESATAVDVRPIRRGGWGYRGSVRVFKRAAWVVRGGPGIELKLTRGRKFTVTVDDAEAGATALTARLTPPGSGPRSRGRPPPGSDGGRR